MSELNYKGYTGTVETSIEDECLHGKVLFIHDVITYEGETVPELKENFKSAIENYIVYCEKKGIEPNKPLSGTLNVRLGAERHMSVARFANKTGQTLNSAICTILDKQLEIEQTSLPPEHSLIDKVWQDQLARTLAREMLGYRYTLGFKAEVQQEMIKPIVEEDLWPRSQTFAIN